MTPSLAQDVALRVWPEKLAPAAMFLESLRGGEALSELFQYELHLLGMLPGVNYFEALLGQAIRIEVGLPNGSRRTIHGLVGRLSQLPPGEPAATPVYGRFRALVVPRFWLWTKNQQNRVFQRQSVPEILKVVLKGLDVAFQLSHQSYSRRNFCVQYQESDFQFASRLMEEEEGIAYFFRHQADGHQLVLTDDTRSAEDLAAPNPLRYDATQGGEPGRPRVYFWTKSQEIMPQTLRLRDSHFELPLRNHLEASQDIADSIQVGQVKHVLRSAAGPNLELNPFPGFYAKHYDNIDPQGTDASDQEIDKVFEENQRVARLGMERIARQGLQIEGSSDAVHLQPGLVFELTEHADAAGKYLLTRVDVESKQPPPHSSSQGSSSYQNHFSCLPQALAYRPALTTPRPRIHGTQTALVVGMEQVEDVYCDKFARVKVQFHWDRQGKYQGHTSCWIRVAQPWAGQQFGALFIPRVGQEVLVAFLEGDPDQPVIVGSLYNSEHLPPVALPKFRTSSGVKSHTVGGNAAAFNGLFLDDAKGQERVFLQSKKDLVTYSAEDTMTMVGGSYTLWVNGHYYERIGGLPIPGSGSGSGAGDGPGTKYVDKPLNNWFTDSWDSAAGYPEKPKDQPAVTWGGLTRPVLKMTMGINGSNSIGWSYGANVGGGIKLDVNPLAFLGAKWDVESAALKVLNKAFMVAGAVGLFGNSVGITLGYSSKIAVGPSFSYSRGSTYKIDGDYPDDPQFQTGFTDEAHDAAAGIVSGFVLGGMLAADLMAVKATNDSAMLAGLIAIEVGVGVALATYLAFEMAPAIHRHHTRFKPYKKALKKAARKITVKAAQKVADDAADTIDELEDSAKAIFAAGDDVDKVKKAFKSKTSSLNFARDNYVVIAQNILLYSASPADQTKNATIVINAEGNPDALPGQENGGLILRASNAAALLGGPGGVYIGNNQSEGDITIDGDADGKVIVKSKLKNKLTIDEKAVHLESMGSDGVTIEADEDIEVKSQEDLVLKAKDLTLEATGKITLKVSGETIVIDSNGITLNGKFIELNTRRATIKSQSVEYTA